MSLNNISLKSVGLYSLLSQNLYMSTVPKVFHLKLLGSQIGSYCRLVLKLYDLIFLSAFKSIKEDQETEFVGVSLLNLTSFDAQLELDSVPWDVICCNM